MDALPKTLSLKTSGVPSPGFASARVLMVLAYFVTSMDNCSCIERCHSDTWKCSNTGAEVLPPPQRVRGKFGHMDECFHPSFILGFILHCCSDLVVFGKLKISKRYLKSKSEACCVAELTA